MFEVPERFAFREAGRMSSAFQSRLELKRNADEFRVAAQLLVVVRSLESRS